MLLGNEDWLDVSMVALGDIIRVGIDNSQDIALFHCYQSGVSDLSVTHWTNLFRS